MYALAFAYHFARGDDVSLAFHEKPYIIQYFTENAFSPFPLNIETDNVVLF